MPKLLGRGPDYTPLPGISSSVESATPALVGELPLHQRVHRPVPYLDDVVAERRRLLGLGSCSGTILRATARRWRRCPDPDGNLADLLADEIVRHGCAIEFDGKDTTVH